MKITPTSCLSGDLLVACFDEIEKISEAAQPKEPKWKRYLKHGAGYALGYAAGHGAGMLIHRGAQKAFGAKFQQWDQAKRMRYLAPLLGASTAIVMAANQYAESKRHKDLAD
jgi:hypothetical protein